MSRIRLLILLPICLLAVAVSVIWMLFAIVGSPARALRIAVGCDQLANAAFAGDEDETISARCWRCRDDLKYAVLGKIINAVFMDSRHCQCAYLAERDSRMGWGR